MPRAAYCQPICNDPCSGAATARRSATSPAQGGPITASQSATSPASGRATQHVSAKRTPDELLALTRTIEETARAKLHDLRNALAEQTDLREVFLTLFPNGLTFTADRSPDGARQVWRISGEASFGSFVGPSGPDCVATPTGRKANETRGCASPCSSWHCARPQHSRAACRRPPLHQIRNLDVEGRIQALTEMLTISVERFRSV